MQNAEVIIIIKKLKKHVLYLSGEEKYNQNNIENIIKVKQGNKTIYFDLSKLRKDDSKELIKNLNKNLLVNYTKNLKHNLKPMMLMGILKTNNPFHQAEKLQQIFKPFSILFNNIKNDYDEIYLFFQKRCHYHQEKILTRVITIKKLFKNAVDNKNLNQAVNWENNLQQITTEWRSEDAVQAKDSLNDKDNNKGNKNYYFDEAQKFTKDITHELIDEKYKK